MVLPQEGGGGGQREMSGYGPVQTSTSELLRAAGFGSPYAASSPVEEIATLWIGNCLPGTSDADLALGMAPYGHMVACFLLKKLSPQGQLSGFVRYTARYEAAMALEAINNGQIVVNGSIISGKFAAKNSSLLKDPALQAQQEEIIRAASLQAMMVQGGVTPASLAQASLTQTSMPHTSIPQASVTQIEPSAMQQPNIMEHASMVEQPSVIDQAGMMPAQPSFQEHVGLEGLHASQPMTSVASQPPPTHIAPQATEAAEVAQAAHVAAQMEALQQALQQEAMQQVLQQAMRDVQQQQINLLGPGTPGTLPAITNEEITTLWIGNGVPGTTDADLASAMAIYGKLVSCFLMKKLSPQGQMSGFVRYTARAEAAAALEAITNGIVVVNGSAITGKWATKNSNPLNDPVLAAQQQAMLSAASSHHGYTPQPQSWQVSQLTPSQTAPWLTAPSNDDILTLWLGNITPGTSGEDLRRSLAPLGQLECCFLHKSVSPQGQLSGSARFSTKADAQHALQVVEAGSFVVNGAVLKAKWARQNATPLGAPK